MFGAAEVKLRCASTVRVGLVSRSCWGFFSVIQWGSDVGGGRAGQQPGGDGQKWRQKWGW